MRHSTNAVAKGLRGLGSPKPSPVNTVSGSRPDSWIWSDAQEFEVDNASLRISLVDEDFRHTRLPVDEVMLSRPYWSFGDESGSGPAIVVTADG
jgi:hypothetical protein